MDKKINWLPLFSTQFLGVFNDHLLKNLICFIGVLWLPKGNESLVIAISSALLIVPYVLFSPLAGFLALKYSKRKIVVVSKFAELPIMLVAVVGFAIQMLPVVFIALFLMGLQSAIYSPAKYGLIKDIGGENNISFGTGTMELLTFIGVLSGTIAAGIIADNPNKQLIIICSALILLALKGWFASTKIRTEEAEETTLEKASLNPLVFFRDSLKWTKKTRGLTTTILGVSSFWLIGSMVQMNLLIHCPDTLKMNNIETSITLAVIAIGIGLGCFVAGLLSKNRTELGLVPIGGLGLSIAYTILAFHNENILTFQILLGFAAFCSGLFKIPLNAWIQERVEGKKLGEILAFNNLTDFLFILMSAGIFYAIESIGGTSLVFIAIAIVSWIITIITLLNIPAMMLRFIFFVLAHTFYKIKVFGRVNIPKKTGALLVANHISLLDSFLIIASVPRMVRFVIAKEVYDSVYVNWFFRRINMIPVASKGGPEALEEFNRRCREEINNGHIVCIFAEGQLTRTGNTLEFKKGIEYIAKGINAPIIPLYMDGIVGGPFSYVPGTSKLIKPGLFGLKHPVTINIGVPMPSTCTAFEVRQTILNLSADTFQYRFSDNHTLGYKFLKSARKRRNKVLATDSGSNCISYNQAKQRSLELASVWNRKFKNESIIGIMMENKIEALLVNLSLTIAGKIVVNIDPELNKSQLDKTISELHLKSIVTSDINPTRFNITNEEKPGRFIELKEAYSEISFYDKLKSVIFGRVLPSLFINTFSDRKVCKNDLLAIKINFENGNFKALPYSHLNILSNVEGLQQLFPIQKKDKFLGSLPFNEITGYVLNLCFPIISKINIHYAQEDISEQVIKNNITILPAKSELIEQLVLQNSPEKFESVRSIISTDGQLKETIRTSIRNDYSANVREGFAIPECSPVVSVNAPNYEGKPLAKAGKPIIQLGSQDNCFGKPLPGIAIKIVDPDNFEKELTINKTGMILIKGPNVIDNYYASEEQLKKHQGWFISGKLGFIDEAGFITLNEIP